MKGCRTESQEPEAAVGHPATGQKRAACKNNVANNGTANKKWM
jgi:hypothetical protein